MIDRTDYVTRLLVECLRMLQDYPHLCEVSLGTDYATFAIRYVVDVSVELAGPKVTVYSEGMVPLHFDMPPVSDDSEFRIRSVHYAYDALMAEMHMPARVAKRIRLLAIDAIRGHV